MDDVAIDGELRPGDLGAIVEQHGRLYSAEHGLDRRFEAYVAEGLAAAVLGAATPPPRFWLVRRTGRLMGSAAVCTSGSGVGQFRWFLLEPELRGTGLGRRLLGEAVAHGRDAGYRTLFLWTFDALEAAAHLYRRAGFTEGERHPGSPWGVPVTEVRWELALTA